MGETNKGGMREPRRALSIEIAGSFPSSLSFILGVTTATMLPTSSCAGRRGEVGQRRLGQSAPRAGSLRGLATDQDGGRRGGEARLRDAGACLPVVRVRVSEKEKLQRMALEVAQRPAGVRRATDTG